jgi:hypothetical protein
MDLPDHIKLVVIGEKQALDRLEVELNPQLRGRVATLSSDSLLLPYDKQTVEGAAQRRGLERLYASMRDCMLVRLVVVNLIPEVVRANPEPPLAKLRREWAEIQRRQIDLLNESAHEGVEYVTILITEEGDWRAEHRSDLQALAGLADDEGLKLPCHRCYLLTRLLELGRGQVFHAQDVWPLLAGNLIEHLARSQSGKRKAQSSNGGVVGLYAWRTVRFVPAVDEAMLQSSTRSVFEKLNRELLRASSEPLFEALRDGPALLSSAPEAPREVVDAQLAVAGTAWNLIGTRHSNLPSERPDDDAFPSRTLATEGPWSRVTVAYAQAQREALEGLRVADVEAERVSVRMRVNEATSCPGKLFPGVMPAFAGLSGSVGAASLRRVTEAIEQSRQAGDHLAALWRVHGQAARCFVTMPERLVIAAVVSASFGYAVAVAAAAAQRLSGGAPVQWLNGILLAACGAGGALLVSVVSHMLQDRRGRAAFQARLRPAVETFVQKRLVVLQVTAQVLQEAAMRASTARRQAVRQTLHQRLQRIELVLRSELQPEASWATQSARESSMRLAEAARSLVEIEVALEGEGLSELDPVELLDSIAQESRRDFLEKWKRILDGDKSAQGFIPAVQVLRLCAEQARQLGSSIQERLRTGLIQSCPVGGNNKISDAVMDAAKRAEVDRQDESFLSVDLMVKRAVPRRSLACLDTFAQSFGSIGGQPPIRQPPEFLGKGVIAVLHIETPIDFHEDHEDGTILFAAQAEAH